jgi:hypothetical protein
MVCLPKNSNLRAILSAESTKTPQPLQPIKLPPLLVVLLSDTVCGIVTPSGQPLEQRNGAARSHHGPRARRTPRAFCRRSRPFRVARRRRAPGWRALLRTNLGRAATLRREIIAAHAGGAVPAGASWRDLPMQKTGDGWQIELPLAEVGYFKAKAYLLDPKGWQHWPDGPDIGISVHPDFARTANTIYCAFTRLFGATKNLPSTRDDKLEARLRQLDERGCAVIPPSGKLRDLARQLPHIVHTLGCRILHLLPVQPTPTTYARFGRFGSPYASLDLTAIDPALVEFDKRTTGVDQFCELTRAAHWFGARVFIDIVINHTGWGSTLQENHPEFFLRQPTALRQPRRLGNNLGRPGGIETGRRRALGQNRGRAFDLVPARRGRVSLRRRLQNSRAGVAIHHRPGAG